MKLSVLVVDDDQTFRLRLARALSDRGYEVRAAAEGEEALALAKQESPEYAVVDLKMPGMSGLELVKALREIDDTTKTLVLTGYGSIATALEAVRLGAFHYLTKPADLDDILNAFKRDPRHQPAPVSTHYQVPSLARAEWEHIQRVLVDCNQNISMASRLLGIHRRSLQRKLLKFPGAR